MPAGRIRIAVDIGGTFTDVQALDLTTGAVADFKTPTTPEDPSIGLIRGLTGIAEQQGFAPGDIAMILHGSTIATNAVLERKLPKGALLTTQGFTDVLEIGRHMRHEVYSLKAEARSVLIPAEYRIGIAERTRADGSVETPVDPDQVRAIGQRLADQGVQAIAVAFLHGYRNPANEQAAAEALTAIPGLSVTTSFETSPEIREFERTSTTVLNALLKPVISTYLGQVEARLNDAGIHARLFLVQSNGGVALPEEAARLPARLLLSGPSGGAMALVDLAKRHGLENLVGVDMGGTSTDVSVVQDGRVEETAMGEIDGLPVRLPMIEIRTIGAGGGSIARAESGALRVGPQSAGAQPGPACYLRGGTEPTVTDANLHLGLIDADSFLGGTMALGTDEARTALDTLAPLGLTRETAAQGIRQVATSAMAGAVRLSLFEKGADPTEFVLASFGGAGGLHACDIAEDLDIDRVLFPATASTLSARGILSSDLRHDLSRSGLMLADAGALDELAEGVADLRAQADRLHETDGTPPQNRLTRISADMRYRGQAFEITTPWDALGGEEVTGTALDALVAAFHALHLSRYAHSSEAEPVEIVTLRAQVIGRLGSVALQAPEAPPHTGTARTRSIWMDTGRMDVPAFRRAALTTPQTGPLIVEEDYSVLWIGAGWTVRPAEGGDLIAERSTGASA